MSNESFLFDYLPSFYRDFLINENEENILLKIVMQKLLFICFCAIVFWAPIPLGSHRIWSAALLETLISCLFIIWLLIFY